MKNSNNLAVGAILSVVLLIGILAAIVVAATDPSMSTAAAMAAAIFGQCRLQSFLRE